MLRYLPIFIVVSFFLEIASIIWVGRILGVVLTLLLIVAGGGVGILLFRRTGVSVAEAMRSQVQDRTSQRRLVGATAFGTMAGLLFLVPGFFSDVVAVLLLLPPVQAWLLAHMKIVSVPGEEYRADRPQRFETVIESEVVEIEGEILPPERRQR